MHQTVAANQNEHDCVACNRNPSILKDGSGFSNILT